MKRGPGASVALSLAKEPSHFLSTIQIGITVIGAGPNPQVGDKPEVVGYRFEMVDMDRKNNDFEIGSSLRFSSDIATSKEAPGRPRRRASRESLTDARWD
jgi:hypothetical protein